MHAADDQPPTAAADAGGSSERSASAAALDAAAPVQAQADADMHAADDKPPAAAATAAVSAAAPLMKQIPEDEKMADAVDAPPVALLLSQATLPSQGVSQAALSQGSSQASQKSRKGSVAAGVCCAHL